jgi:hypothetical protein
VYLVGALILVVAAKRGLPWAALLPALGFYVTGLLAIRNIVPASVVVVAMVAPAMAGFAGSGLGNRGGILARGGVVAGAAGLVVTAVAVMLSPGLSLDRYPVDAVDYLEARDLVAADDVVVVHREGVGNYLTFRYGPDADVFIDDRFDFYPVSQTSDHLELLYGVDYEEVLDRQEADVVLWQADSSMGEWLIDEPSWSLAFSDDEWLVVCRRSSSVVDRCLGP